jgi:hypothetical protein
VTLPITGLSSSSSLLHLPPSEQIRSWAIPRANGLDEALPRPVLRLACDKVFEWDDLGYTVVMDPARAGS